MSTSNKRVKKCCQEAMKRNGKLTNAGISKAMDLALAAPDIETLKILQDIACGNASAWQAECNRLTDEIADLQPPGKTTSE